MHRRVKAISRYIIVFASLLIIGLYFLFSKNENETSSHSSPNPKHIEPFKNEILITPRTYSSKHLHKWDPAPIVLEVIGLPGEMGKPVHLDTEETKKRFSEHQFNVVVCEMISMNRSLTDIRDPECLKLKYQSKLPDTSIVIIFHNEAWCTLIRSIWSVINRSPKQLLKEIILVDDQSTLDYLGKQLDEYVETLPVQIRILRMEKRSGIVSARLRGAEIAQGKVVTFLDSHIECGEGWLEPLLSIIAENRRVAAIPVIDIIKDDTFEFVPANKKLWGGFDWKLLYKWVQIPKREKDRIANSTVAPLFTPTMAGGLFSMDKEFFFEIGAYDEGMIIWGSENLEMSFRLWMCGGILEMVPCSRVGHVYRRKSPYNFPDGSVQNHNRNRLVDVWFDEWVIFYDALNPGREKSGAGDISARLALRKTLNCKNFQWYVDNIYPEVDSRTDTKYIGQIQSAVSQRCITAFQNDKEATLRTCNKVNDQIFLVTKLNEIQSCGLCLDAISKTSSVKTQKCHQMGGNQKWEYDEQNRTFRHNTGSCLQLDSPNESWVNIKPCDGSKEQQWLLIDKNKE